MKLPCDRDQPLVILGSGYTGRFLYASAKAQHLQVLASSRSPDIHLADLPAHHRFLFDLERPGTWAAIPQGAHVIWCFPAVPKERVIAFADTIAPQLGRLVVLGSTSAYSLPADGRDDPPPWLDESSPVNLSLPRVQGEEYLRRRHGATILRVAGIYGPGRTPVDWIRRGRVTASSRFVNLIHVDDLAEICLDMIRRGKSGEVYNVSDGTPRRWSEICDEIRRRWGVVPQPPDDRRTGTRISNVKLRREFGYAFRYPDLYEALAEFESDQARTSEIQGSPGGKT